LLLDDALSSTPVDSHPHDLNGPNSVSWMSDAASSDASHLLYREMDPYNQAAFVGTDNRASPGSGQFDPSEQNKEGGWVAVTKVSDAKHGTTRLLMLNRISHS
uniref:Cytochrome cd1 nitrite reductase n=1 Tax=Echinostoma caproni TaxID=27848 RepID=A0A183B7C1_9TREM